MQTAKDPFEPTLRLETLVSRRALLRGTALAIGALTLPTGIGAAAPYEFDEELNGALDESRLVYVSPLLNNGSESKCHGEVWFARDEADVLVVTASDRWKCKAIRKGLDQARLWVGDWGVWTKSDGFRQAPHFTAKAVIDKDPKAHAKALAAFGSKYRDEWDKWGPRFRAGLKDESRVLIRYTHTGA